MADGKHTLIAIVTDKKNRHRLSSIAVTVFNKIGTRPPDGSVPGSGGLSGVPLDCGPFSKSIGNQHGGNAPALAVFQNRLHLVTSDGLGFGLSEKRLQHYTMSNRGVWSGPETIENRQSGAGVALAVFQNRLHMVYRSAKNSELLHSTFDGREWSPEVRIPDQQSRSRPALIVFQDVLHMVYLGQATNTRKMFRSTFRGQWTLPIQLKHRRSVGPEEEISPFTPALIDRGDFLRMGYNEIGALALQRFSIGVFSGINPGGFWKATVMGRAVTKRLSDDLAGH